MRSLIALAALPAIAAVPAMAAEVQIPVTNPVVELTVMETVLADPDYATVGAGVTVRASTVSEALKQNAAQMRKVVDKLKSVGVAAKDIQTSNFNLNPQYQYRNDGQAPTFLGYEASNQVTVKLRNMDRIGETLDALANAGATNFFGPNFGLEKDEPAKAAGRKSAFNRAQAQATDYARMAGYTGLRLLEISETYAVSQPMPQSGAIVVTAAKAEDATPIEPGQVGTGVTVTVKFEMTR
ncbi:MAG: SIMPL domain-containing protein [Novosphingobium sp.]|nr:SIMPL domain-containing protein [Novosphingobium sp.]